MLNSNFKSLGKIKLPEFTGKRKYMHTFNVTDPIMAKGFEEYLQPVIDLCAAANLKSGEAHMTVDEKLIKSNMSQRRPGPHVDGCYKPEIGSWGHGSWCHSVNRMTIILASDIEGCRAWKGNFHGEPSTSGDLSHIQDQLDTGEVLRANTGYLLSPDCIHESLIFNKPVKRIFLRIAFENNE